MSFFRAVIRLLTQRRVYPYIAYRRLAGKLYEVHDAFKKCVPYYPTAAEICKEIEDFILELQQKTTLPQQLNVEELTEQGAV